MDVEQRIRSLRDAGDIAGAATLAVRTYGPEIYGLLVSLHGDDAADDVFSVFTVDLWRGLPAFEGKSSLRTWAYVLARHASVRHRRRAASRRRHEVPVRTPSELDGLVQEVRTATATFLRTESRDLVQRLREGLSDEERELLVLRVDRDMDWRDVARILGECEVDADAESEARACGRLRKRFQAVKEKLRDAAARERDR